MCSRVLATIFIIYCFNSGLCEEIPDIVDLSCKADVDCEQFLGRNHTATCLDRECVCTNSKGKTIRCEPPKNAFNNLIGQQCPCKIKNSHCDPKTNACLCNKTYVRSSDKLRCIPKSVSLNETCEDDAQCLQADHWSECNPESKLCMCQKNYTEHQGHCLSVVALQGFCETSEQCRNATTHSICSTGRCACEKGFVASSDEKLCLSKAGYGEKCKETGQCRNKLGTGSRCDSGICICDENHFNVTKNNGKEKIICERKITLGDECSEHNECYLYQLRENEQSMECVLHECVCREGYVSIDSYCIKNGAIGPHWMKSLLLLPITVLAFYVVS